MQSLTIYKLPPTLNEMNNVHYMKRAKMKEEWEELVIRACRENGIRPMGRASITLELWFPDKRRRDLDNYGGFGFKWILDGLVKAGVLKDDSTDYVGELGVRFGGILKPSCVHIYLGE